MTLSPGALSQETIFPSVTVDERAGMNTSFTAGAETFLFEVAVRDAITPAGRVVFVNEDCGRGVFHLEGGEIGFSSLARGDRMC